MGKSIFWIIGIIKLSLKRSRFVFLIFMEGMMNQGMACSHKHHHTVPVLVMLFGLVFLLKALNAVTTDFVNIVWPVLVIAAGLSKMTSKMCKCC